MLLCSLLCSGLLPGPLHSIYSAGPRPPFLLPCLSCSPGPSILPLQSSINRSITFLLRPIPTFTHLPTYFLRTAYDPCIRYFSTCDISLPDYSSTSRVQPPKVQPAPAIFPLHKKEWKRIYQLCFVDPSCRAGPRRSSIRGTGTDWLEVELLLLWVESNHPRFDSFLRAQPSRVSTTLPFLTPPYYSCQIHKHSPAESSNRRVLHSFNCTGQTPTSRLLRFSNWQTLCLEPSPNISNHLRLGKQLALYVRSVRCELSWAARHPSLELSLPFILGLGIPFELNYPQQS